MGWNSHKQLCQIHLDFSLNVFRKNTLISLLDILSNFKSLICCSIYNVIVLCCYLPKYSSCIIDKFVVNISTSHLSNSVKENWSVDDVNWSVSKFC